MTQPEALRLADALETEDWDWSEVPKASAELRRLHAVVQAREDECETHSAAVYEATRLLAETREQRDELLKALKTCVCAMQDYQAGIGITEMFDVGERIGRAAIIKAKGKT